MKLQLIFLLWVVTICTYDGFLVQGAPLNSEKDKDEFVFLLPNAERSNLYVNVKRATLPEESPTDNGIGNVKDSYGNPIIENGNKIIDADGIQFEIPSYASGITEIRKPIDELLPPLTSGEIRDDAGGVPEVSEPPVELLPPLFDDYNQFTNTQRDNSLNDITNRINIEPNTEISVEDTKSTEDTKNQTDENTTIKYDGEKYTGGFGGAPGILGEQKEIGYAVEALEKSKSELSTEPIPTTIISSSESDKETTVPSTTVSPTPQDIQDSSNIHTTETVVSSSTEIQPEITTLNTEILTSDSSKKETENPFPTPIPSFLFTTINSFSLATEPFEIISTPQNIPQSPSVMVIPPEYSLPPSFTSTTIQQHSSTPTPTSFSERFGFEKTTFNQEPTFPQNQNEYSVPLSAPEPKKQFDFSSNIPRIPQTNSGVSFGLSPTSPFFVQSINTNKENKYTGGFGGATGILGNQAKPGYAIQPDGSIKDPDHTYRPPAVTAVTKAPVVQNVVHQQQIVTPVKYEKYTGGFGGPPGVLHPYDNKNSG